MLLLPALRAVRRLHGISVGFLDLTDELKVSFRTETCLAFPSICFTFVSKTRNVISVFNVRLKTSINLICEKKEVFFFKFNI